jgi:protein ImuB
MNEAAEALGLAVGEPLADARAKAGFLQVHAIDTAADDAALRRLALWATRYTPTAAPWGEADGADGFFLDIEGASHLFGGEAALIADLAFRLQQNFGLSARLAVAATPGTAWAAARFHRDRACVLPSGGEARALAPFPIEALRLSPDTRTTLRRLGFKTVGALLDKPRAPFAARFPAELLRRVDQALGRIDEPLVPVIAPPVYHCLRYLLEPIVTQEAVVALASRLMQTLAQVLVRDDVGARRLRLALYRVDGAVETIDIALTLPTRSADHVTRLLDLRLEALAAESLAPMDEAGFGFEAIGLAVTAAEPMPARQTELTATLTEEGSEESCAALIDTLRQRLGPASVRRFAAVASYLPERAEMLTAVNGEIFSFPPPERGRHRRPSAAVSDLNNAGATHRLCAQHSGGGQYVGLADEPSPPRPLLLLPKAEPAEEVLALVPDGPPRRFSWRGETYEITGAEGPERIGAEWWRASPSSAHSRESGNPTERQPAFTRDYYLVEDGEGRRFWLYREGLYGRETAATRWFVHGLFA